MKYLLVLHESTTNISTKKGPSYSHFYTLTNKYYMELFRYVKVNSQSVSRYIERVHFTSNFNLCQHSFNHNCFQNTYTNLIIDKLIIRVVLKIKFIYCEHLYNSLSNIIINIKFITCHCTHWQVNCWLECGCFVFGVRCKVCYENYCWKYTKRS